MGDIITLMLLGAAFPILILGLATLVASTYSNYIQKRKQRQAQEYPLLGVVMPKTEKSKSNA